MSKIPRARYTPEFRAEAVKLVLEKNMTPPEAAARLGVLEQTFGNWVKFQSAKTDNNFIHPHRELVDIFWQRWRRESLPIDTDHQPLPLRRIQRKHSIARLWPNKSTVMQTPLRQPDARAIPQQHFEAIAALIAKGIRRTFDG